MGVTTLRTQYAAESIAINKTAEILEQQDMEETSEGSDAENTQQVELSDRAPFSSTGNGSTSTTDQG